MKTSKRIISFVLCAVMVASCFFCTGKLPELEAKAATVGDFSQTRVVSNYESLYKSYQKRFFAGEETNWPTDFVIPGLSSSEDYTPQGMTYWAEKEWILISAYDASSIDRNGDGAINTADKNPSVIYALDVVSTNLVAVFKIQNADGSVNTSHGGGIAASKYNFYYADSASKVSYVPLSEMDISGGEKTIKLKDSVDFAKEMTGAETGKTVKTSYCCYDDGILWTGNFNWSGEEEYNANYHDLYKSVLMGYKLSGNSSEEEWYYLKNGYNLATITRADTETAATEYTRTASSTDGNYSGTMKYTKIEIDGAHLEVRGSVTSNATEASHSVKDSKIGEITTGNSGTLYIGSFDLVEGTQYKISFVSTNADSDIYMWSPAGTHCNVKQAKTSTKRQLDDGRWYYEMIFTAGLKPTSADSGWPTTQSTDGSYTGTYKFRIDQDRIVGNFDFAVTDISVCEYNGSSITVNPDYEGVGCAGNPTYVVAMDTDRIQYAMVDKGKLYVSRSWSRNASGNHTRELMIADIDLNRPGDTGYTVNGRTHNIYLVNYDDPNTTHFGGNYKDGDNLTNMLWMGEALCVIDDYLYMFGEGAAWHYNGKDSSSICGEPIDVIWKIDQYAIQGLTRPHEDVTAVEYEKVNSLSEINDTDEYIIAYESSIKDPVSQDNILYLLDSFGGYGDKKLSKKATATTTDVTAASTGDSRGIVGYEIRDYSVKTENGKESLILNADDDANKSLHWQFESGSSTSLRLKNRDLYFAKHPYLYVGDPLLAMTGSASSTMTIKDWGNGTFTIYGNGEYYSLWCNDGSVPESISAYTKFYGNHGQTNFVPNYHGLEEVAGTFHTTNSNQPATPTTEQQALKIYKRVSDPYASSYETQVYTDLSAKLTSDGTYNITLETYATDSIQYQRVEKRPTDFIFVLDLSGSMDEDDAKCYKGNDGSWTSLTISQIVSSGYTSDDGGVTTKGIDIHDAGTYYYKTEDGSYYPIYAAVRTSVFETNWIGATSSIKQNYWVYFVKDSLRYVIKLDGSYETTGYTYDEMKARVDSDTDPTGYSTQKNNGSRQNTGLVPADYYYNYESTQMRIDAVKNAVDALTYKIAAEATDELDHRIAIVSSASDDRGPGYIWTNTGIYTNDSTAMTQYTGEGSISEATYKKAFFSVDKFGEVRTIVSNLKQDGFTYINNGLELAGNIVEASDADYDINGSRSAVVIVISDGAAGGDTKDTISLTSSNESANGALSAAYDLKRQGAYIFSVRVGDVTSDDDYYVSGFDYDGFMKYLSSKYMGSKSMTDIGPVNPKEYQYYTHVPGGDSFSLEYITDTVFNAVTANSVNAISSLTAEAILREHLTDAFDLTNATITYQTAQSKYDGIGRLYFEDPVTASGFTTTFDKANNNIEVKGFDYSANNVSEYNSDLGNGKKLIVTISGVIADADAELLNTSINDTSLTALYENSTYMSSNQPVKKFPTYHFSIPEYTYYMDYDIPMYDSDINGTLCSVDSTLQKQSTYKTSLSTSNMGIQFVNGNQDMVYTLNSQGGLTENLSKGYVLIERDNGTYDWFRLNIVPASTVYYEENKMETINGTSGYKSWTSTGSYDGKYQSLSTNSDIFGNDYTYSSSTDSFSLGTNKSVTVSSSEKRSNTQTFTFTGTGFDLISACGPDTGIQTVVVRDANGNLVQTYIVDTFYNDTTYGTVTQVPVVQFKGNYGTYSVETTAAYYSFAGALKTQSVDVNALGETGIDAYSAAAEMSVTDKFFAEIGMDELIGQEVELIWMDEDSVLNGGIGATETTVSTQAGESSSTTTPATSLVNYIDGFRIYNPVDYNDEYINNEKDASYYSVIEAITAGGMGGDSLAAYIEPGATGDIGFGNYLTSGGPKYEVYLESGDSIAFNFKANYASGSLPQAMVSVRAASTKNGTPKVKFGVTDATATSEFEVKSASETFYNVTNMLGIKEILSTNGTFTLTVTNTGSGLLAVDNIKFTNAELVPINGVSLAELEAIISTQAVEIDPYEVKSAPATFVDAPADDPNIDPEGRIPTLEEYIAIHGSGNNGDDHSGADSFADKLIAIVEKVIDFIKKVIALVANTVTSIF